MEPNGGTSDLLRPDTVVFLTMSAPFSKMTPQTNPQFG